MTAGASSARPSLALALALTVLVLLLGVWPWHPIVHLFPHGSDATKWVTLSHPTSPGWVDYVFWTRHFIGYRPISALTFTLCGAIGGFEPWAYRLVDITLHAAVGALLFALYRGLTGDRSAWGLLAPLVFFLHPATEDVVPYLARRSYSLSCVLALGGLWAFTRTARSPDRPWRPATWVAALLLTLAMLSNEVAGIAVAILPLIALHLRPSGPTSPLRALLPTVPAFAMTAVVVALRGWVLGNQGGYRKRYFAYTLNGRNVLRQVDDHPYLEILGASWRYAFFPTSARGADALWLATSAGVAVAVAIGAAYTWFALARPWLERRQADGRLPLLLVAWLLAYTLLYAATRNWFWRQGYPMLLPLSLLVAVVARRSWTTTVGSPRRRLLAALPQLALLASLAWHSPALRGVDQSAIMGSIQTSELIHELRAALRDVDEPARVWLAAPGRKRRAQAVRVWSRHLHRDRRISFKLLAVGSAKPSHHDPSLTLRQGKRPRIELAKGMAWTDSIQERHDLGSKQRLRLEALHLPSHHGFVFWRDGERGVLTPVPPPRSKSSER